MVTEVTFRGDRRFDVAVIKVNSFIGLKDNIIKELIVPYIAIKENIQINIKDIQVLSKNGNKIEVFVVYTYNFEN